jgi:phosphate/sulfate permease
MLSTFLITAYVYLSLAVAYLGRRTRLGLLRSLMLSLIITPVVAFLVLFFFFRARVTVREPKPSRWHRQKEEVAK